jgi:hypothetical protein
VLVDNAGFGAGNAAPVARKMIDAYLLGPDGKVKPSMAPPAYPAPAQPPASQPPAEAQPEVVPQKEAQLRVPAHRG